MKDLACEACARRKVRCDRAKPKCGNCMRRKHDQCIYEAAPADKIRRLEGLVRRLGGDPEDDEDAVTITSVSPAPTTHNFVSNTSTETRPPPAKRRAISIPHDQAAAGSTSGTSRDPVLVEEDGQSYYLESRAWAGWLGNNHEDLSDREKTTTNHFMTRKHPHALQGLWRITSVETPQNPSSQVAQFLWETFYQRAEPLFRFSFRWSLEHLQSVSVHSGQSERLKVGEKALVSSIYLIASISLSNVECQNELHKSRSAVIDEFHIACEEALSQINVLFMKDMTELKAFTFYVIAGFDRLSTQSLWSLLGLISRNAERLGIHRDGTLLGLSPVITEERRRLWWQLQHLELGLGVRSGLTPLNLMADWDVKLPLNIEDDDINLNTKDLPTERKGLTSMSYSLFTYWIIDQQRSLLRSDKGRFQLSWQSDSTTSPAEKQALIDRLEDGINQRFLQYCDPIKPLHVFIQLLSRAVICGMRLRTLHPLFYTEQLGSTREEHRQALTTVCTQSLEYSIAQHSLPTIRNFHWFAQALFPWQSLMCIVVEISQQNDPFKTRRLWDLLSDVYSNIPSLSRFTEDRRRYHAAKLVVAAWNVRQRDSASNRISTKPQFVVNLELALSQHERDSTQNANVESGARRQAVEGDTGPITPNSLAPEQEMNAIFDLDFQDIDWSFWSNME